MERPRPWTAGEGEEEEAGELSLGVWQRRGLVSVTAVRPSQEVAGSGRARGVGGGGIPGDRVRVGGVVTPLFLLSHGRALLFSESRRFLAEGMRVGWKGRKRRLSRVAEMSVHRLRRGLLGRDPRPAGWAAF